MFFDGQLETLVFGVELGVILRGVILLIYAALLVAIAITDLRLFIIPNSLVIALLALWPFWVVVSGVDSLGYTLLGAVGVFLLGAVLFSFRLMGGGDVKLLTVLALWSGLNGLLALILVISIAGGFLSLLWLNRGRAMFAMAVNWMGGMRDNKQIPYGVAIAVGGLLIGRGLWLGLN